MNYKNRKPEVRELKRDQLVHIRMNWEEKTDEEVAEIINQSFEIREELKQEPEPVDYSNLVELDNEAIKEKPLSKKEIDFAKHKLAEIKKEQIGSEPTSPNTARKVKDSDILEKENKKLNLKISKRLVDEPEMKNFRSACDALAVLETKNFRDGNARDKLTYALLTQSSKLVDLWNESNELLEAMNKKNVKILELKNRLDLRVEQRESLEKDNSNLTQEIANLHSKLAATQQNNADKEVLCSKVMKNLAAKKLWYKNLNTKINKAKNSQDMLQSSMSNATTALAAAFAEFDAENVAV